MRIQYTPIVSVGQEILLQLQFLLGYKMSDQLRFIVEELKKEPFNRKNINLITYVQSSVTIHFILLIIFK